MAIDAMSILSRVLERAMEKYVQAQAGVPAQDLPSDAPPDQMLIDAFAGQLLAALGVAKPAGARQVSEDGKLFLSKLQRVTRAVGACHCLGEIRECPDCGGLGVPGWRLPDRQSFEMIVRPALDRVSSYRLTVHNGQARHL